MENNVRITALYQDYNTVIKPLIAEVEARTEQFPCLSDTYDSSSVLCDHHLQYGLFPKKDWSFRLTRECPL